jgi:16S rRNA processing protein RimM
MSAAGRRVLVGRIVGLYGVQGWLKFESWTEPRAKIFDYQPWLLSAAPGVETEVTGIKGRPQGKGLICYLPDVDDRDKAAALVGHDIYVAREQLPPPGKDEYYWVDLEGLEVVTTEGVLLGRVSHLFATGANDVVVVGTASASGWFLSSRAVTCVRWICPAGAWWWTGTLNSEPAL